MSDDVTMRARLQLVAAYRDLCRSVQRSGRENVVYAFIMGGIGYYFHSVGGPEPTVLLFGIVAVGELLIGLFKWMVPTAESFILDALVLLAFAGFNFWIEFERFQRVGKPEAVFVFLGLFMLFGAINRIRYYIDLRRMFAERPDPEHIAWFDDLVREIQASDPHADELALDLPTRPHWKARLLGGTAFFVATDGTAVWVAGPGDFTIRREKADRGTGHRRALLNIHGENYPEFELEDRSWDNYTKWLAAQAPLPPA